MAKNDAVNLTDICKIKENKNNPRLIKDKKFEKLVKSIKDFPKMLDIRPIIVDENMVILGGNMRFKAIKELGIKQIEIKQVKNLTEEQKKEFIIKDNLQYGQWEWDLLANEWETEKLEEWGLDIDIIIDDPQVEEDDFDIPDEVKTDIVLGDLFEIREHRLLCGDSTDGDQVAKLMNEKKADMVFTDPPYNINYGNIKHPKFKKREIENDDMSGAEFKDFCKAFIENIKLFCDGIVYCWAGPGKDGRIMFTLLDEILHNSTVIIWNKDQFTLGRGKYQNKYEPCWFGWINNGSSFVSDRTLTNVWDFQRPKKSELHPTMKPIGLIENALKHSSKQGNIILDLFLGSGSTMVASHQLKRKCYGMELDSKYCQVIIDRMRKLDPEIIIKKNGEIL